MTIPEVPWYANGLRFSCSGCGTCCQVEGYVWVDEERIRLLAEHLDLTPDEFGRQYVRRVGRRYSLIEKANHECIFWEDGCQVYEARPSQCRTFPFWPEQLASRRSWAAAARTCRGIGQGRHYSHEEIRELAKGDGATEKGPSTGCDGGGCS